MEWRLDINEKLTICGVILLLGLAFLLASPANAQATPSDDPAPVPLEAGEPAPYAGDLWSVGRSLRLVLRSEQCEERSRLDLDHADRDCRIDVKYERVRCDARAEADTARIALLSQALDEANPWWRSPAFVAAVTLVATLALVTVVAVVLERVAVFANLAAP